MFLHVIFLKKQKSSGSTKRMEGLDNVAANRYQYNAPSTIAIDHHNTGGLNNGGKMKICCTFEVTE